MANYKLVDADQLDADLKTVADAIREKGGTTDELAFPDGMASAVEAIQAGGGDTFAKDFVENKTLDLLYCADVASVPTRSFYYCMKFKKIDLPNVTDVGEESFYYCYTNEINLPSATTVGKNAFSYGSLASINLPNVTYCGLRAFAQVNGTCKKISLPKLKTTNQELFYAFNSLEIVEAPLYEGMESSGNNGIVSTCRNLKFLDYGNVKTLRYRDCSGNNSLIAVALRRPSISTAPSSYIFENCYHYHGTVNATYNPDGLKDGYIYVPRALVDSYKTATNWTTFADQFRALEDYTVDGTTTGAMDWDKINGGA